MKKLIIAVSLALIVVMSLAVPAIAAPGKANGAVKADLILAADGETVVGFAVINTNGDDGLNVEVAVKDLEAGTYVLKVQAPIEGGAEYTGEIVVGENGKGNAHVQIADLVYTEGDETIPCRVNIKDSSGSVAATSVAHVGLPVPLK